MDSFPDTDLLRLYATSRSQAAFAELVQRHVGMVYRTAWRYTGGNSHEAEDISQRVFTEMARQSRRLSRHPQLAGWLCKAARFEALHSRRSEIRRRKREHAYVEVFGTQGGTPVVSMETLDSLMQGLGQADRELILQHYLSKRSYRALGKDLGLTEDAVRMRAGRALEELRRDLLTRGIATSGAAIAAALSAEAATAIPPFLTPSIIAASIPAASGVAGLMAALGPGPLAAAGVGILAMALATVAIVRRTTVPPDKIPAQEYQAVVPLAVAEASESAQGPRLPFDRDSHSARGPVIPDGATATNALRAGRLVVKPNRGSFAGILVAGQIAASGFYPDRAQTVGDVIRAAGGVIEDGNSNDVHLVKVFDDGSAWVDDLNINLRADADHATGDADLVYVPYLRAPSEPLEGLIAYLELGDPARTVTIRGSVAKPGKILLPKSGGIPLHALIVRAGGFLPAADPTQVTVTSEDGKGRRLNMNGREGVELVRGYEMVFVPQRAESPSPPSVASGSADPSSGIGG